MPTQPRRVPFGRLIFAVIAGFVLASAVGTGALFAYQGRYADRIFPGVRVAGVDVAGLDRDAAREVLALALASYGDGSVVVTAGSETFELADADLGRAADIEGLLDEAFAVGRFGDGMGNAADGVRSLIRGTDIVPRVTVDAAAAARAVQAAASRLDQPPVSATASASETGFATSRAAAGRGLAQRELVDEIVHRLADPAAPGRLELTATLVPLEPAVTDAAVTAAVEGATRMSRDVTLAHDKETWTIPGATVRSWISFAATPDGRYAPVIAQDAAAPALTALAEKIDRDAADASFLIGRDNTVVGVVAGKDGRKLDVAATSPLVAQAVLARAADGAPAEPPPVALAVTTVAPKLTTEQAQKAAPLMQRISTWTTKYPVSERNGFGANITIPTRTIDGYVVPPGAVFDFWQAIGEISVRTGYKPGGAIIDGKTEPTGALAGGICSCSTTLFNAAVRAGLEILARRNHYYYIDRYPLGLDATVFESGSGSIQTMSFRNDTAYPILIRGYASPGTVRFSLFSVPTGRTVTFTKPIVTNRNPGIETTAYTTSIPVGTARRLEYPTVGMRVTVSRTVTDASGAVIHHDVFNSNYARVDGLTLIGRAASDTGGGTPAPSPRPSASPRPSPSAAPSPVPSPMPSPS
jgi:vancomycin resistance protein YoaR